MTEIIIDLPWPPSQNQIWRRGRGRTYRHPKYMAWLEEVGWLVRMAKKPKINGHFTAHIVLNPPTKRRYDVDNYAKVALDAAQKFGLIHNDHLCRKLTVEYGTPETAPLGARLTLATISGVLPESKRRGTN